MFASAELDLLCCPDCRTGGLDARVTALEGQGVLEGVLGCDQCGQKYPINQGIPHLMPERKLRSDDWKRWRRHLDGLQERRRTRREQPKRLLHRIADRRRRNKGLKRPFGEFIRPLRGRVLDVGCGSGKLRSRLNSKAYFGLDPIVLEQAEGFPLVHGVAEYLPFKANSFSDIAVIASLDHFGEPDLFFEEAVRLLEPGGRLHLAQQIHEVRSPLSLVQHLTHEVKDRLESRRTGAPQADAPKHISEFSSADLVERLGRYFHFCKSREHVADWYSPNTLFLSLTPRKTA
jgi:uncharacterized protein YbaR (Trm112 family)